MGKSLNINKVIFFSSCIDSRRDYEFPAESGIKAEEMKKLGKLENKVLILCLVNTVDYRL